MSGKLRPRMIAGEEAFFEKDCDYCLARQAGWVCYVGGAKIQREVAHQLPEFTLRNMSMPVIPIWVS